MVKEVENQENVSEKDENILDFEDAKNMTVGQAVRKQEELQAGVTEEDSVLDRYIKQHRQDIESEKYETKQHLPLVSDDDSMVEEEKEELRVSFPDLDEETKPVPVLDEVDTLDEDLPVASTVVHPFVASAEEDEEEVSSASSTKKNIIVGTVLSLLLIGGLALSVWWFQSSNKEQTTQESSSSSTTTTTSSSSQQAEVQAFDTLYDSFFTDASQTKLKNTQFDKLADLKALLDQLDPDSTAYQEAKEKYDNLAKAIQAIQTLNQQFDKTIIVDGELDTTATVKADADLTPVATGISGVDATITAAINFARSQQENAASSAAVTTAPASSAPAVASNSGETNTSSAPVSGNAGQIVVGTNPLYGIAIPAGVTLQRNLSRVPYDQAKIDDVTNPAWTFNPGVLEQIIAVSQERGYVNGYQYILEPVNIINGNGYYNLFRPDGTYLFSMNAKTGYFVGNGAGYADDLDY